MDIGRVDIIDIQRIFQGVSASNLGGWFLNTDIAGDCSQVSHFTVPSVYWSIANVLGGFWRFNMAIGLDSSGAQPGSFVYKE